MRGAELYIGGLVPASQNWILLYLYFQYFLENFVFVFLVALEGLGELSSEGSGILYVFFVAIEGWVSSSMCL